MLEVALAAGVSPETLRKIESGRVATPAFSTIAAIAAALDLSLDRLWRDIRADGSDATPMGRHASETLGSGIATTVRATSTLGQ